MPPKNKNKRKTQGKQRKNSQQGSSQASSPSTKANSPNTTTTATSSTVDQELITPGALDLRLSNPGLAAVDEDSTLPTPTASDVMSEGVVSPDPSKDDVEYQEDDGMKTPTATTPEVPESAMKGATAAAAAAATGAATQNTTAAPAASYAQKAADAPVVAASPPKSEPLENPFADKSDAKVDSVPAAKMQKSTAIEDTTFEEVPLESSGANTNSTTAPAEVPHRAMTADEVPTLQGRAPAESVSTAPPVQQQSLASPPKPHETGNPFLNPGAPVAEESAQEYRSRTHTGYEEPRPFEPVIQMDAAPDAAPTDNFVTNGGANQAATEEPQNVWAPGQQGFERSEHAPSTPAALDHPAAAASSSSFVVVDDSLSETDVEDEPDFTREGQTGLWKDPTASSASQQASGRQLTPAEGPLPNNAPPTSYPFPAHTTASAHDDNQSPKSLLPSDPQLPLPETFEPRANTIAPLGPDSIDNVAENIELPELPEESLDGFLNPWTRSQQTLPQAKHRIPSPATEEAAISTPDLSKITTPDFPRTTSANSSRSNEPLMPSTPLFASKKFAHLGKISSAQLRGARPSVMKPRGPNQKSSKYGPESTSSGHSARTGKIPPPAVVEADLDDVRLDPGPMPFQSQPRGRFPSLATPAPVFMRARNQGRDQWDRWNSLRGRTRVILVGIVVVVIALVIGLAVGLMGRRDNDSKESSVTSITKPLNRAKWVPKSGDTWEFQTRNRLKDSALLDAKSLDRNPTGAAVFDIDLFLNDKALIKELHANGTRVVCSFSAGTVELWRPDASYFPSSAQGLGQVNHMGARWLDINDGTVQQLMRKRIDLAANKDCDAVDPAFVDGYQWPIEGIGFEILDDDAVAYVKMLAEHAHSKNLAIGLRRSPSIAARVMNDIDFSVCESCSKTKDCAAYRKFLDAGKPVFHVEYANETASVLGDTSREMLDAICNVRGSEGFSTIVKRHNQDEWVVDCAGRD